MSKTLILSALVACLPVMAAETTPAEPAPEQAAAPATVEERLAAVEAELAALREQLAPETLAKLLAQELVAAQRKAMEPPTPEEAVGQVAAKHGLDAATQATLVGVLQRQQAEQEALLGKIRSGEIPRDQIREQLSTLRDQHRSQLGEHLDEAQIEALQEAQRPPAMSGRGGGFGRGGFGGFGGDRGDRGDRGNRGGRNGGDGTEQPPGRADF